MHQDMEKYDACGLWYNEALSEPHASDFEKRHLCEVLYACLIIFESSDHYDSP